GPERDTPWVAHPGNFSYGGAVSEDYSWANGKAKWSSQASNVNQNVKAILLDTNVIDLKSEINGVEYRIYVTTPEGYEDRKHYSAMYLLDGGVYFPYMSTLQKRLAYDISPTLFISIGYAGESQRMQDYPSVADSYWKVEAPRGAATFLRVLAEEIIPLLRAVITLMVLVEDWEGIRWVDFSVLTPCFINLSCSRGTGYRVHQLSGTTRFCFVLKKGPPKTFVI
ncbi:MAG: hypothetical protein JKY55_19985, partial [Aliivibrio sp.]|nr:hypothetical protein [Aliivibrio sp.]